MFGLGTTEMVVIFLALLLIFGSKKLPELARGLGKGIKEFNKATREIESDLDFSDDHSEDVTAKKQESGKSPQNTS